jgi:hypothetical protein
VFHIFKYISLTPGPTGNRGLLFLRCDLPGLYRYGPQVLHQFKGEVPGFSFLQGCNRLIVSGFEKCSGIGVVWYLKQVAGLRRYKVPDKNRLWEAKSYPAGTKS